MRGLDPRIHAEAPPRQFSKIWVDPTAAWIAGSSVFSPAMTIGEAQAA